MHSEGALLTLPVNMSDKALGGPIEAQIKTGIDRAVDIKNDNEKDNSTSETGRKGKWTIEEELYANKLIEAFNEGTLILPEKATNLTLRSYLAEKLGCDPMRITKKYTGEASLGKRAYNPSTSMASEEKKIRVKAELAELELQFREKLMEKTQKERELLLNEIGAKAKPHTHERRAGRRSNFYDVPPGYVLYPASGMQMMGGYPPMPMAPGANPYFPAMGTMPRPYGMPPPGMAPPSMGTMPLSMHGMEAYNYMMSPEYFAMARHPYEAAYADIQGYDQSRAVAAGVGVGAGSSTCAITTIHEEMLARSRRLEAYGVHQGTGADFAASASGSASTDMNGSRNAKNGVSRPAKVGQASSASMGIHSANEGAAPSSSLAGGALAGGVRSADGVAALMRSKSARSADDLSAEAEGERDAKKMRLDASSMGMMNGVGSMLGMPLGVGVGMNGAMPYSMAALNYQNMQPEREQELKRREKELHDSLLMRSQSQGKPESDSQNPQSGSGQTGSVPQSSSGQRSLQRSRQSDSSIDSRLEAAGSSSSLSLAAMAGMAGMADSGRGDRDGVAEDDDAAVNSLLGLSSKPFKGKEAKDKAAAAGGQGSNGSSSEAGMTSQSSRAAIKDEIASAATTIAEASKEDTRQSVQLASASTPASAVKAEAGE